MVGTAAVISVTLIPMTGIPVKMVVCRVLIHSFRLYENAILAGHRYVFVHVAM